MPEAGAFTNLAKIGQALLINANALNLQEQSNQDLMSTFTKVSHLLTSTNVVVHPLLGLVTCPQGTVAP